jgi:outer membrane protein assembly factor BamB
VSYSLQGGNITWMAKAGIGYDIAPSVITCNNGIVFVPTDKGLVYAIDSKEGTLLWAHRITSCLITQVLPVDSNSVICTSMDGIITKLKY